MYHRRSSQESRTAGRRRVRILFALISLALAGLAGLLLISPRLTPGRRAYLPAPASQVLCVDDNSGTTDFPEIERAYC
jgi:hypothetical protein